MWWNDWSDDDRVLYNREAHIDVSFYRPDGDIESKSIDWCKTNGFFQVGEDLWSGEWYYEKFPEERPKKCPVCPKQFDTEEAVDKHVRITYGKAHARYRSEHGIQAGLTEQEKEEERAKEQERKRKRKQEERWEYLEIISDPSVYSGYQIGQARKKLREIDERDYEFDCPVKGCHRRFENENSMYRNHLRDSGGNAHQIEREKFEQKFHYGWMPPSI
ncbi:MAG: hypothetical protein SGARI_004452 [Bacillariaceae sp.]